MQNIEIFIINLARSKDRRESMREKIAKIQGFGEIYIDGVEITHPLRHPNAREGESLRESSARKWENVESSLRGARSEASATKQSTIKSNLCDSTTESRPLRGAKNRIQGYSSATADFLLEAEKRGSPPKSEKRQLLGNTLNIVGGSGEGGAALLRKEKSESNKQNGKSSADSHNVDSSLRTLCFAQNDGFGVDCHDSLSQNLAMTKTLNFHFFPATDANDFKANSANIPKQYSSKLTRFVKGKDLSFGEIACFSSHYRLWEKCVALDSPIVVLEDDIDFMQDFCQIAKIFNAPFEYVRLVYTMDKKITHLQDNFYISFDRICGTMGYYLTPTAAQKFIKNARFWLFCVDDYMDMFFIHNVKNIIFLPFIIAEDSANATQSTILGRTKPKMNFWQKLTRELSRIYFYVIRKGLYFALHCVEIRANFGANRRQNRR